MTLRSWLSTALAGLEPPARSRLESEYTSHVEEAVEAHGDRTQALTDLGDPAELNARLRQMYLTGLEAERLDKVVVRIRRPLLAWGLAFGAAAVACLLRDRAGLLYLLAIALTLGVRAVALRTTTPRRAALLTQLSALPAWMVVMLGSWQHLYVIPLFWGTALWLVVLAPNRRLWAKVWRHG